MNVFFRTLNDRAYMSSSRNACSTSYKHIQIHTNIVPWWERSTQRCTAVSEYIAMAVGIIVILPSF